MTHSSNNNWEKFYVKYKIKNLIFPSETLIRCFKGDYIKDLKYAKKDKILDVGFGSGNNLIFFNTLGFDLYGVELTQKICQKTKKDFNKLKIKATLKVGNNKKLFFKSNFFDFLISWDVIHYEKNLTSYKQSLNEYTRVLKPNGRLIISTVAPKSSFCRNSKRLTDHTIICKNKNDIRYNEKFTCFNNMTNLKNFYNKQFNKVSFGRHTFEIFDKSYDSYLINVLKQ